MTKKEFMRELAQRLSQIPANEKARCAGLL